jgi:hypothetical protein
VTGLPVTDTQLHNDFVTANVSLAKIRADTDSVKTEVQQLHVDLGELRIDVQNLVPIIDAINALRSDVQNLTRNTGLSSNLATIIDLLKMIASAMIGAQVTGDPSSVLQKEQPLPPP